MFRFLGVEGFWLFLEVDIAVGTGAGTSRPHNQESGRSVVEALADVGTGGFFADGVEAQVSQDFFDVADALPLRGFHAQPVGFDVHSLASIAIYKLPAYFNSSALAEVLATAGSDRIERPL